MNEDIINLTDILLNNFYLNTKNILVDVCYNLQILYKTQQKIYKNTNDFSNIIYKGIEKIDSIFQDAYTFTIDLSGNNNVILDYSSNLLYDDLGFIITRKNGDISYITQEPNTTKTYLFFNFIDVTVTSQSDLCLNLVGDYSFNYSIVSNNIDLSFTISRNITIRDIEAPTIELSGGDLTFEVYSNIPSWFNVENNYGALIKDNYSPPNDLSLVVIIEPIFDISKVGNYTFTYTLTDSNNNVTSATRIVRVVDTTNPTFTLIGDNPLFWNASTPYVDPGVDPSDNYDLSLTILIDTDLSVNNSNKIGLYYYKYTIIDDYDNSVNVTRQVYIIDYSVINNIPVINIPEDASGNITNIVNNVENTHYYKDDSLTLSDNFAINLQNNNSTYLIPLDKLKSIYSNNNNMIIFVYGFKNEVISIINSDSLSSYKYPYISSELLIKKYVNLILDNSNNYKLIVLDGNFNPYTSVFDPSLTILGNNPFNLQINTDFNSVDPGVIALDYNGNDINNLVVKQGDLDITNVGNYEVLYIATDLSGHQTIKNRIVTVYDDILPVITLNGDKVVDHLVNTPYVDAGASVSDNADTNPVLITTNNVNVAVLGTYQVIYNATDFQGNKANPVTRTVNVIDNIAPTLTLIGDASINILVFSEYNDLGVNVNDNYFTNITYMVNNNVDTSKVGTYIITYTATDPCNNVADEVTRTVNVIDVSGPTIVLKPNADGNVNFNLEIYNTYVEPGFDVSDNLDDLSTNDVDVSGVIDISNLGTYTITYTATDSCGNTTTVYRTVTVVITSKPIITLSGDAIIEHPVKTPYNDAGATVSLTNNYFSESDISLVYDNSNLDINKFGSYIITYNATDPCGNRAVEVTRTVNVKDNEPPVITLNGDTSINIIIFSEYFELGANVTDNYFPDFSAVPLGSVDTSNVGTYIITYTATDPCNNVAAEVTRTVNVIDVSGPTIVLKPNADGNVNFNLEIYNTYVEPGFDVSDNLDDLSTNDVDVSGVIDISNLGTYTITYTATDSCGNTTTVYRTVTVVITSKPIITLSGDAIIEHPVKTPYNDAGATVSLTNNYFSESDISLVYDNSNLDINKLGSYIITYNATDPCGNQAIPVTRTVNVVDNEPPVITLIGSNPEYIEVGSINFYSDTFNVVDNYFTTGLSFTVTGDVVDPNIIGTYIRRYNASDPCGNQASEVIRTVIVYQPKFTYEVDGSLGIIKLYENIGTISNENLDTILTSNGWNQSLDLKIIGINNNIVWTDFQFSYSTHGMPNKLHIENISLESSIDDYAIYSIDTLTTMKDVDISGYSRANITDTVGGALRIRSADYSSENHDINNPTLSNVNITNCCRGIRIQDSNAAYIVNCSVNDVTDNALYFAAYDKLNSDTSIRKGCTNCVFYNCTTSTVGQVAFMNIGGANNKFINCDMSGSRGAAVGIYNTNGYIEISNCTFTNANTIETTTPWGGNTDDFNGAAVGFSVLSSDVSGYLFVHDCSFNSGDGSVFYKAQQEGTFEVFNNTINLSDFSDNILSNGSFPIIGINNNKTTQNIIINPSLIDYEIPSYYQSQSGGSIVYTQPNSYYKAYCVPTSFANVLNYYNDPTGKNLALQLNYTSQNSHPPLTDFLYNYQGRPLTATGITDLNKIDIGYILNTNAHGFDLSDGSYSGTKLEDFSKFVDFMNLISPTAQYRYYNKGFDNDISFAYSSVSGESVTTTSYNSGDINNVFSDIKSDISNGRPIILSFNHWNIVFNNSYDSSGIVNISGESVYLYDFSGQVSSTLDIQSTNPLYSNPEYIYEMWDPDNGLGHTVTCVGYIENMNNKNWVIVQDNVNNLAMLSNDPNKTPTYVGVPLDASYLTMVTTIDFSPQGTTLVTNLPCLLPDSSVNIDSSENKYVFNNGTAYDESLKYGLYNGNYIIRNVPSTHPIAFLNNDVSNVLDYSGTVSEDSLQVNGVNYNFYSGDISLTVGGDFGTISAYCLYHGYMGTQNKFIYTTICNPVINISLTTNISFYNPADINNTLPQGYSSCLRLGNNSDICANYIVNNEQLVEQNINNIGIFIQNEEVYLQANSTITYFYSIQTIIFKIYDEQLNLLKPLQDINIILENSEYELLNQSNPDLNHFIVTANPPLVSSDSDLSKYTLGPGLIKIGNLVRL